MIHMAHRPHAHFTDTCQWVKLMVNAYSQTVLKCVQCKLYIAMTVITVLLK